MDEFNFFEYGVAMAGELPFDCVDFMHITCGVPFGAEGEEVTDEG